MARQITRLEAGQVSGEDFVPFRVMRGIYGIRGAPDHHMVRVKVPGGRLQASQAEVLARIAEDHASGVAHVTTRQDVQLHWVHRRDLPRVLELLGEAGLTTREAGGNTVRNVTACHLSGTCPHEEMDALAYGRAIAGHFLRNPLVQNLPRKFKIAVSGCPEDCAMAAIHDVGAVAAPRRDDGGARRGFRIYVGGGLGSAPRAAVLLEEWTPAEWLLATGEAVVRVFDRLGDREKRHAARLKFVVQRLGEEQVRERVLAERRALLRLSPDLERDPWVPPAAPAQGVPAAGPEHPLTEPADPAYGCWRATNVLPQRPAGGRHSVAVGPPAGDLTPTQLRTLARLAREMGDGTLVTTQSQGVVLTGLPERHLPAAWQVLSEHGLAAPGALGVSTVVGCPGSATCNLAITQSHRLAVELTSRLRSRPDLALAPGVRHLRIRVSGCPNSCGHHHVADVGLYGVSRHRDGRAVPAYQVLLGGWAGQGRAEFGVPLMWVPARTAPDLVVRLLELYLEQRQDEESFRAWVLRLREESATRPGAE